MIDVRKLRETLGFTQIEFSKRYGIKLDTLRKWEQGVREPAGPAEILLMVIEQSPSAVEAAAAQLSHGA
jgi:putative transcriptional regulator